MIARRALRAIIPTGARRRLRIAWSLVTGAEPPRPAWEHVPEGWSRARTDPHIRGWNVPAIRDWHRERFDRWSSAFDGAGPLGISEYAEDPQAQHVHSHNVHVSFAYALALAAGGRPRMSVLDWGGGIGQHYLLARSVLPEVEIEYHSNDMPLLSETGRELLPQVTFTSDESCLDRRYDFVMASNSFQYAEDWRGLLARLALATDGFLYLAQVPTVETIAPAVVVQRPYAYGYETEYLGWVLRRDEVSDELAGLGLEIIREFFYGHELDVAGLSERPVHRGYLARATR